MLMILPFGARDILIPLRGSWLAEIEFEAAELFPHWFFFGSDLPLTSSKTIGRVPTDTPLPASHHHPQLAHCKYSQRQRQRKGNFITLPSWQQWKHRGDNKRFWEHKWSPPPTSLRPAIQKHDDKWRHWSVCAARATAADVCRTLASKETHKLSRGWRGEPEIPSWELAQKAWTCQRNDDRYGYWSH